VSDDRDDDDERRLAQEAIEADERATRPLSDDVEHSGCPHDCPRCGELVDAYLGITPRRAGESRESKLAAAVLRLTEENQRLRELPHGNIEFYDHCKRIFVRREALEVDVQRVTAERDDLQVKLAAMTAARDELADWATRYDARRHQQGAYASELLPMFTRIGDRTRDARIAELLAVGKESS
jgi:plasmid stabilization system protein ParE